DNPARARTCAHMWSGLRYERFVASGHGTCEPSTSRSSTMKIRTLIRLTGMAAIGGVAYVHQQRGAPWTIAGIKDTLRYLQRSFANMLAPPSASRDTLERAAGVGESATRGSMSEDRTQRSYTDYMRSKNDPGHH